MDFLEQFKTYLVEWCHKKQLPVPKKEWSHYWQLAWKDFMKEVLATNYSEINDYYNSMDLVVPHKDTITQDAVSVKDTTLQELIEEEPTNTKSDWEIVQELMHKKK